MFEELTAKQETIAGYVTQGLRNREIAALLGTTEQVIKNYLRAIYDKLGVSSRLELAMFGLKKSGMPAPVAAVTVQPIARKKADFIPSFATVRLGLEERQAEMRGRMLQSRNHRDTTSKTITHQLTNGAPPSLDEKQAAMRERSAHVGMDFARTACSATGSD